MEEKEHPLNIVVSQKNTLFITKINKLLALLLYYTLPVLHHHYYEEIIITIQQQQHQGQQQEAEKTSRRREKFILCVCIFTTWCKGKETSHVTRPPSLQGGESIAL